jgi:hypothetical protein
MELDELKSLWQQTDRRFRELEPSLRLQERLARAAMLERARAKQRPTHLALWYEATFGAVAALLAGSYLTAHFDELRFAIPAVLLHLSAILTLGLAVWQLVELGRIDYGGPVVAIQRSLARLGVVRARGNRWLLLASPLLWAALMVVVPHGLIGLDVYRTLPIAWVGANFLVGLAVLAAGLWASRSTRFRDSRLLRALGDDLTGRRLAAVSGSLDELAEFEREG